MWILKIKDCFNFLKFAFFIMFQKILQIRFLVAQSKQEQCKTIILVRVSPLLRRPFWTHFQRNVFFKNYFQNACVKWKVSAKTNKKTLNLVVVLPLCHRLWWKSDKSIKHTNACQKGRNNAKLLSFSIVLAFILPCYQRLLYLLCAILTEWSNVVSTV